MSNDIEGGEPVNGSSEGQCAEEPSRGSTRRFRPLLLGPSLMLAAYGIAVSRHTDLGQALDSANAMGSFALFALVAWVVCCIVLSVVNSRRKGVRLPLAPVMVAATALTVLGVLLAYAFVASGGQLVGTVPGSEFLLLLGAGACAGVGFALTFSGWNTSFGAMSTGLALLYLVVSFVIAYLVTWACRSVDGTGMCALIAALLAIVGAGLLHVQVKVIDKD
ncbi:MAG: hypothetical protein SOI26_02885 [Coriobacteriales bacterium]|jgi:uncharacterized membrane protein YhdT